LNTKYASESARIDSLVLLKFGTPSGYLSALFASIKCFFLHSSEQTGCFVSLHQRFAALRQQIHQPNLPTSNPNSFCKETSGHSFLPVGIGFNGIRSSFSLRIVY